MWPIFLNEIKSLRRNQAFVLISIGFVALLGATIYMGKLQTESQNNYYQKAKNEMRQQWENIDAMNPHTAAHYGTYVFKPTNLLSSLDDGVNSITGNVLRVEGHVQNEMVHAEASQMQVASKFGKLKSSLLLQYILPLMLIFLAFNSISSEKFSGRLKLLNLQGAKISFIIWAKTLSVWFYGVGLLTATIASYAILNVANLTLDVLTRSFLLLIAYALFYFVICGLTVYFTSAWRNGAIALTSMLAIWIIWTIFLPNILMTSIEKWHDLPSRNAFQTAMSEDRSKGIDGHNPSDERDKALELSVLNEYGVDSLSQLPINFDGIRMQADEEYGNMVWDKHFGQLRSILEKQKQSYQIAGLINPFISLQNASMGFSASDNLHHNDFLIQVEQYRRGFIKELNDKHAFGGSKTGDWEYQADNSFYRSVPDYTYKPISIASVFPTYLIDSILLIVWSFLVGLLLSVGTKKMQLL